MRNLINRRNVIKKPKNAVAQCEEFFLLVVKAHIVCAAMTLFGMTAVDSDPAVSDIFPSGCEELEPEQRRNVLVMAAQRIVDKYVNISLPETQVTESEECKDSGKSKASCKSKASSKSKHSSKTSDKSSDLVLEYASETLTLGLFLMEFMDAIREGDGDRIIRCWRFFMLLFKASNRTNYSIEAFTLLCQFQFIFSERMKQQLVWSRTVNTHGRPGKNISMDLHMEHLNRECKATISGLGANVTEQAVKRVGKCLGEIVKVTCNFDSQTGVNSESGYHTTRSEEKDFSALLQQLNHSEVFTMKKSRKHNSFPKINQNLMKKLHVKDLEKWMEHQWQNKLMYD